MVIIGHGEEIHQRSAGAGLLIRRTVDHTRNARVDDRPGAHRARLKRNIERAAPEPPAAQRRAGLGNGLQLGVRERRFARFAAVAAAPDDPFAIRDDAPDRDLSLVGGLSGKRNRLSHIFLVCHGGTSLAVYDRRFFALRQVPKQGAEQQRPILCRDGPAGGGQQPLGAVQERPERRRIGGRRGAGQQKIRADAEQPRHFQQQRIRRLAPPLLIHSYRAGTDLQMPRKLLLRPAGFPAQQRDPRTQHKKPPPFRSPL